VGETEITAARNIDGGFLHVFEEASEGEAIKFSADCSLHHCGNVGGEVAKDDVSELLIVVSLRMGPIHTYFTKERGLTGLATCSEGQ